MDVEVLCNILEVGGILMVPWSSSIARPDGVWRSWGRGFGCCGDRSSVGGYIRIGDIWV